MAFRKLLFRKLAESAGDSVWKELGQEVLKSAFHVLVEEGIEAAVEVWKKRRLKIQEEELEKRAEKSDGSDSASAEPSPEVAAADAQDTAPESGEPFPDGGSEGAPSRPTSPTFESLSSYAKRQSGGD